MIEQFSKKEFKSTKSRDKLPLTCLYCGSTFYKTKHQIQAAKNPKRKKKDSCKFCCQSCQRKYDSGEKVTVFCSQCKKEIKKHLSQIKKSKSGNQYCSRSCAAKYNNAHKKHGTRRSKLEIWLEEKLSNKFPNLKIHFNRKDAINSELDIYFPSLNLAFELNGIFHYEPIFGPDKLLSIQNNDQRKFQACIENKIELCIIDTSSMTYFKPSKAQKYLDIILRILASKTVSN